MKTQQWHQTWTDSSGLLLQLKGGIDGEAMVMTGETLSDDQRLVINKINWIPNKNGSVRQHWQVSQDGGQTWQTAFDGLYEKVINK